MKSSKLFHLTGFIIMLSVTGCAPFSEISPPVKLDLETVENLNGTYQNQPEFSNEIDSLNYKSHSGFNKFYRKYGRGYRDTVALSQEFDYTFSFEIVDNKEIRIGHYENDKKFRSLKLKYKIKPDGYLYIRNKNILFRGVPYIIGGIDIKKLRLSLNDDQSLVIEEVYHSSGGFLVFGDSKTWHKRSNYEKIK